MSKRGRENRKKGAFVCGKCGDDFLSASDLGDHVAGSHKRKPNRRKKPAAARRPRKPANRRPRRVPKRAPMKCEKCGRDKFKSGHSFAAHKRYCKGALAQNATVLQPLRGKAPFAGPSFLQSLAKLPSNGQNPIEKLRQLASGKRQEAAEIDKLVEEFETKAQKLLE